jgi:hypothetical protein
MKKVAKLAQLPLSALFFFISIVTAQAATYYVATTGNDASSCTQSQSTATPKRTFASAIACLSAGDTLYIRGGTWTEQMDFQGPNKSGTSGNYITIAGYPNEIVILRVADSDNSYGPIKARGNRGWFIFENLVLDGISGGLASGWSLRDGNHDFILRNLEIKNFKNISAVYVSASNITIQNCRLHDQISTNGQPGTRHYGVYFHDGSNGIIEENDIYNNAGGGIQVYGQSGSINNVTIRNNKIHDNNTWPDVPVGGIVVSLSTLATSLTNVYIYNNLIYNNGSAVSTFATGAAPGLRVDSGATGTKIWNNTIYRNKGYGVKIDSSSTRGTALQNNIVFANTTGAIYNAATDSTIDHNLTTDPNFTNAAANDFTLRSSSPAIDGGLIVSQVLTDLRKKPRPEGFTYDVGAYEGGATSASPSPPKNLKVQ